MFQELHAELFRGKGASGLEAVVKYVEANVENVKIWEDLVGGYPTVLGMALETFLEARNSF